jgi:hypothetical protein
MTPPATLTLSELSRLAVLDAFARHAGNRQAIAAELQISERTLRYWLRAWGVLPGDPVAPPPPPLPQSLVDLARRQLDRLPPPPPSLEPTADCSLLLEFPPIAQLLERQLCRLLEDLCVRQQVDVERRLREILATLQQLRRPQAA